MLSPRGIRAVVDEWLQQFGNCNYFQLSMDGTQLTIGVPHSRLVDLTNKTLDFYLNERGKLA